jgi:hypothetical protein
MTKHTTRTVVVGLAVVAAGVLNMGAGTAGAAEPTTRPTSSGAAVAPGANQRAIDFWTRERMTTARDATARVRGSGSLGQSAVERGRPEQVQPAAPKDGAPATSAVTANAVSAAATASEGYWQGSNTANPNRQVGRLFYQQWDPVSRTWKSYNCSGTAVNSENKSVVWTAGHCVFNTYANTWNRNYMFCPGYRAGNCALGKWTPYRQSTTTQWQNATCTYDGRCNQNEFKYDFGALQMNSIYGYRLVDWVGGHGISFNGASVQTRYLFGYPLNKSAGEYMYFCYATNTVNTSGNLQMRPCTAGGGASGGPWLSGIGSNWMGVVHSVNSHGDDTYMGGPYQGSVAQSLFGSVRY